MIFHHFMNGVWGKEGGSHLSKLITRIQGLCQDPAQAPLAGGGARCPPSGRGQSPPALGPSLHNPLLPGPVSLR